MTTSHDHGDERLAMLTALVSGDVALAHRITLGLLGSGVPFDDIAVEILGPVQVELGRRWAVGDLGIAHEHAASAAVEELLLRLGTVAESPHGPGIVVASAEHDSHALGARVVASALTLEGYRVMFLGASVPAGDLAEFLEMQDPLALVLSCSIPTALAGVARSVAAAHEVGVPVLGGGSALTTETRARALGCDGWATMPRDAITILKRWEVSAPDPFRTAPEPPNDWTSISTLGPLIVAEAVQAHPVGPVPGMAFTEELLRVLQAIESALTVHEPSIIDGQIDWLRATGPAHGFMRADIDAALHALADAMEPSLHDGATALRRALG